MALALGCSDAPKGEAPPEVDLDSQTTVAPVAGGARSARIANWHAGERPEFGLKLLYSTYGHLELVQVVGAVFLPDSSLVIADLVAPNLTFLDRQGELKLQTGREGEGPGDYSEIARIGLTTDESLFVYDRGLRRITFLDWAGEVVGVRRNGCPGEVVPLAQVNFQGFVGVLEPRAVLSPGVQRPPLLLIACGAADGAFDTLGAWPGKERYVTTDRGNWIAVGFGRTALYDGRGVRSIVGTNDSLDLTRHSGSDVHDRVLGGAPPANAVTPQEREEWTDLFLGAIPEPVLANWRSWLELSEIRNTYPALGAVKVDAGGRTWIGEYAKLSREWRRWLVIGLDGIPIGVARLPAFHPEWLKYSNGTFTGRAFVEWEVTIPSPVHELLDVAGDRVALLRKGDLGEEFVEVYELSLGR